jgi:hypothetical protein
LNGAWVVVGSSAAAALLPRRSDGFLTNILAESGTLPA